MEITLSDNEKLRTSSQETVMRGPLFVGQDDALKSFERLESSFLSGSIDVLEDRITNLIVVAERREVVFADAEFGSFRFEIGFVREDNLEDDRIRGQICSLVDESLNTTYGHWSVSIRGSVNHQVSDQVRTLVNRFQSLDGNVFSSSELDQVLDSIDD